ncbi:LysR family transcriptional regulator [Aureimonas flava]|uniref:LysR family transcriptional regulator n=1 Tax=Aureimonas flava TaxID=2320271 RepID=A0A3A1WH34_9HYPH|nr:LysR family transcriptional regulator [Aureimonas flava]RIX99706.1 LysR family transcriptional regulator [Aureimonas flava]
MPLARSLMPSLQELTTFEAAARHGNFTMAAAELALTQSAVSKQVRQLEETLGVVLFDRTRGRITLTRLGERYMRSARRILRQYETETHGIISAAGAESALRLAVLPTFASRWLIPRLPEFLALHPDVTISMTTEPEPFDFGDKAVDVAIHYGAPNWPHGEPVFLCRESIVAVASPRYVREFAIATAADLAGATLLQQASRPSLWHEWFQARGAAHPHPYRGPLFDQFAMTSQAAVAGMGVALVPTFLVETELASGQLAVLDEPPLPGSGAYYVVTPLRLQHTPLIAAFVDWLIGKTALR